MHIPLGNHETRGRISFNPIQPESICGVHMHQGAKHIVIGGGKVSHQFLRAQPTSGVKQLAAGPSGVVQIVSEYVN
jgi:hypothetical protein